jgi:predicted exporter
VIMTLFDIFRIAYHFFLKRRWMLYGATIAVVGWSIWAFKDIRISGDIKSMLPDDQSDIAVDFELLRNSPFTHKIIINLNDRDGNAQLIEIADRLVEAMTPPLFSRVITGPSTDLGMDFIFWIIHVLPNLATPEDLERVLPNLTRDRIHNRLKEDYDQLLSFEGWFIKDLIREDPLDLRNIGLDKLRFMNIIPQVRLEDNHFISLDGRHVLFIAETPVDITDADGSEVLLRRLMALVKEIVPENIDVSIISTHRYTLANAQAVKRDLLVVLGCSALFLFLLFMVFLRRGKALFVFLVPFSVVYLASVGVSLIYDPVSAITIGFGSVLLGISVDFAVHVYFALQRANDKHKDPDPAEIMGEVSRPVLFGGLTTLCAFGVLLFSSLPGQRQLSVFSMIGVGASLLLSLILLPHLVRPSSTQAYRTNAPFFFKRSSFSPMIIWLWVLCLLTGVWQGTHVRFDGDLNALSIMPTELRAEEERLKKTWGSFRDSAMIYAQGTDLDDALRTNDLVFQYLLSNGLSKDVISLAPVLPSSETQLKNRQAWNRFWHQERKDNLRRILEEEGGLIGFSDNAFSPFLERLADRSAPIRAEDFRSIGLGDAVDSMTMDFDNKASVLTLVPDKPEIIALMEKKDSGLSQARMVSQTQFSRELGKAVGSDFVGFIIKAFILVIFLLVLLFHDLKKILVALIPVVTGLAFMFGVMGLLSIKFNLFNIVASILVVGLGVDYGIFMVCRISEGYEHNTDRAVLFSGLTTIAGFGALVLARHPALHSIGLTVLLGISAAIPSALFVIPALYRKE